jgi:hypothetical protein
VDFPILDLLDERACFAFLVDTLHPQGLRCPGRRGSRDAARRSRRDPVLDYHCADCGRVFNAGTGALLPGARRTPAPLVPVVRGLAQGAATARPAREPGCCRRRPLDLRRRPRRRARASVPRGPLPDGGVEADDVFGRCSPHPPAATLLPASQAVHCLRGHGEPDPTEWQTNSAPLDR